MTERKRTKPEERAYAELRGVLLDLEIAELEAANRNEDVAIAHGIVQGTLTTSNLGVEFALTLSKLSQAAYGAWAFGEDVEMPLASAATLAELFHQRLRCLSEHGRFVRGPGLKDLRDWPWLTVSGDIRQQEEVGFRAIIASIRHVLHAEKMECEIDDKNDSIIGAFIEKYCSSNSTESFLEPIQVGIMQLLSGQGG